MDEKALAALLKKLGLKSASREQVKGLSSKLDFLQTTHRYGRLLRNLETANDEGNFTATVLEATIAYQFESKGMKLEYEVQAGS